ncbi:MAG: hypothetical protein ACE5GV_05270 [Candidatus Scalindua sp.]
MNNINAGEYLVLAITCWGDPAENNFLKSKGIEENEWYCLGLNNSGTVIVNLPDTTTENPDSLSFLLINQNKWKNNLINNDEYKNNLNSLSNKKKIIYTHIRNGIQCSDINIQNTVKCIPFHHWTPPGKPLKEFLEAITVNNNSDKTTEITEAVYCEAIKKLIEESLKETQKSHLIALSILCQGYLAANEEHLKEEKKIIKLPEGISISKDKKGNTIKRDWWKPALGEDYKGDELKNELKTEDKLNDAIECLIEIIRDKKVKKDGNEIVYFVNGEATDIGGLTEKVNTAYGQLKNILGAAK